MTVLTFTIGEVADLLGTTPQTIRHYHKIGLLDEPLRDTNNYRCYSIAAIEDLQAILNLKRLGLSLKQIKLILKSGQSDQLMHTVLLEQEQKIKRELMHLTLQLDMIQNQLQSPRNDGSQPLSRTTISGVSTTSVLADSIRPVSSGLTDIIIAVEGDVFSKLDMFPRMAGYDEFIHRLGKQLAEGLIAHERLFIFWMERYLALGQMDAEDLQGKTWLSEIEMNVAHKLIASTLQLPVLPQFSTSHQVYLQKLFLALLIQESSGLQKQFLALLIKSDDLY